MSFLNRVRNRFSRSDETTELMKELARLRKEVRHLTSLVEEVRSTQKQIPKIIAAQKYDGKWRATIRSQITALLRAHYVESRPEMTPVSSPDQTC